MIIALCHAVISRCSYVRHFRVQLHHSLRCMRVWFSVLVLAAIAGGISNTLFANEAQAPTAEEVEAEMRRIIGPVRSNNPVTPHQIGAAIASTFGPSAVAALAELTEKREMPFDPTKSTAALIGIAILADDRQAFDFMKRRVIKPGWSGSSSYYLTYMPPTQRDTLLWQLFVENIDIHDSHARGTADLGAFLIAEFGDDKHLEAVLDRLKSSWDKELKSHVEMTVTERRRLEHLLRVRDEEVNGWKLLQFRAFAQISRPELRRGTLSARGLPTPYCVARARFPGEKVDDPYVWFCGEGGFWQALQDTPGVTAIAADEKRPEELRRRAIKILVEAPKFADNLPANRSPKPDDVELRANDAFQALRDLAKNGDVAVRTWIAEAILAHDRGRNSYARIMGQLAYDEALPTPLREKCAKYARGER